MACVHEMRDTDQHFTIDAETMAITNPNANKNELKLGDHNSEIFTFEVPRFLDKHDLSLCDKFEIHYINIGNNKADQSKDVYYAEFALSEEDENIVVFTWKISGNATMYAGSLNFRIRFACIDEAGNYTYKKHTDVFKGITVSDGIDNAESLVVEFSDVLEQWKNEVVNDIKTGAKGDDGKDGVGIQSVEQTTTSTEDGGTNIVTVTKTDGTSSTFQVMNGSKGDKGDTGATGEKGETGETGATGKDGNTPFIGSNGNWWIGEVDTGIGASGGAEVTEAVKIVEITATAEMATATYIRVTAEEFPALKDYNVLRVVLDNVSNVSSPWHRLKVNGVNVLKTGASNCSGIKYLLRLRNGRGFAMCSVSNPSLIYGNPYDTDHGIGIDAISDAWVYVGDIETVEIGSHTTFIQENATFAVYGWNE